MITQVMMMAETKTYKVHSTRLKRMINPLLRKLQNTDNPFVIASVFNDKYEFLRYTIKRVHYERGSKLEDYKVIYIISEKEILKTIKFYLRKIFK